MYLITIIKTHSKGQVINAVNFRLYRVEAEKGVGRPKDPKPKPCDLHGMNFVLKLKKNWQWENPLPFTGYLVIVLINTNILIIFYHFFEKKIYVHNNNIINIYFFSHPNIQFVNLSDGK